MAAGLGEFGPAPGGVFFTDPGFDSILGIEAPVPKHLRAVPARVAPRIEPTSPPAGAVSAHETANPRARPQAVDPGAGPAPRSSRPATDEVVAVDEAGWQVVLSRPGRLQQLGWMVSGPVVVGNHRAAHAVIPENRTHAQQVFEARDYFRLSVRGRRGQVELVDSADSRALLGGAPIQQTSQLEGLALEVARRDEHGEEDFAVCMHLRREAWLPDPRAQLLSVDLDDRLVAALFTCGFPLRAASPVRLGPIDCIATYAAGRLVISDYLDSYAYPDGSFQPFFHRSGDGRFRTAPEDGSGFELRHGDMLIAGISVYRFEDS